jgi:hypothetical protein
MEEGAVGHIFEMGLPKDYPCQAWFKPNFCGMILGWPLPKLCPVIPTSNQDGRQAKNRKRVDEIYF